MKKKMTVLCGLLIAVFVTAYSVSGTYAKYTSSMSTTDSARVARWDISIGTTSDTLNLFKNVYGEGKVDSTVNDSALVVAPGTNGSYTLTFGGETEVAYTLKVVADIENNVLYSNDAKTSPIKFSIDGGNTWFEYTEVQDKLNAVLVTDSEGDGKIYSPGEVTIAPITLEWKWVYDASEYENMTGIVVDESLDYDALDTELGQSFMAAYNKAYNEAIEKYLADNGYTSMDELNETQVTIATTAAEEAGKVAQEEAGEPTITIDLTITATQVQP